MQTVLAIDDDAGIREVICVMLEKEGFRAICVADGKTGLQEAMTASPNLIIIDLRMPGLSGVDVCKTLRAAGVRTPLIVLSAVGDEIDKVLMLEIGADDYVVKPFSTRELLARIRAVLRRSTPEASHLITFSDVEIDLDRSVVRKNGNEVKLTRAEYKLLVFFVQNPDRPLNRDVLLNSVWGYEYFPNTRTVDAHVVRLRQKLETESQAPRHFVTLHGVGYRFIP
jgi:DNA-binding response OmpR family regulator